jgi:hypothetical protein
VQHFRLTVQRLLGSLLILVAAELVPLVGAAKCFFINIYFRAKQTKFCSTFFYKVSAKNYKNNQTRV